MTDQEVWLLIFEAGFSTAEQVTDVSGRGVGMDVVKRNINAMGGRVEIESMTGIGTRMTVRLPLTLAILDGMSVAVGQRDLHRAARLRRRVAAGRTGHDQEHFRRQAPVVQVRGEYLPVIALHEVFGIPGAVTALERGIMVILEADGTKAALFVDALVGQQQVVIKSLEANYRKVTGVSGATIMGDGHVALILDVAVLAGMAQAAPCRRQPDNRSRRCRISPMTKSADRPDEGGFAQEYLTFTLGPEEYAIDILKVQEIRGYEQPTTIANAPAFIKGVINLRGTIVPIVDLRIKFGVGKAEYTPFTVVIILNIAEPGGRHRGR